MNFRFVRDLSAHLAHSRNGSVVELVPELCPPEMKADLTVNAFKLAKALKSAPMPLAEEIRAFLAGHADVAGVECIKAFVNVRLKPEALFRDSVGDAAALLDGRFPEAKRRRA